ncbi:hypothetical protein M436DRAFT_46941 [Aureobasidium namibiae CBS 147.97]|uniref:Zn(2)-C6 fungal-type domain-containing protein n=1 Tax=Aureobasidium namibiae CBS 147.97 TaxID=1043004 RepID=A0A074WUS0_9PEZI
MVCVPRSKGCAACLSKHVKCDEVRPECTRCQKSGRRCPGYHKEIILKHYDADGSRTNSFKSSLEQKDHMVRRSSTNCSKGSKSLITDKLFSTSPSVVSIFTNQVVSTMIVAISPEWQVLLPSQRYTRIWLQEVITRAESDTLLRSSARALSLLCLGITTGAQDVMIVAQSNYTSALKKMQSVISRGNQAFANIQSAAMLLAFYELLRPSSRQAWIQHAGGVASIMKIRGPAVYTKGFDKICYMAMRNYLVSDAIISGTACFLAEADWILQDEQAQEPPEMMFRCHVKLPGLLHDIRNKTADQSSPQKLHTKALALREQMVCCFHTWVLSKGSLDAFPPSCVNSGSLYGYAYKFSELQSLILYCSHYASLIVINNIIMESWEGYRLRFMDECNKAAAEIAACVDQAQSSLLTNLSLKFWLQAAAHGCAPSDASWFMNTIQRLSH